MVALDPAYVRNRGVGLFLSLCAILVSTYQVILLSHRKRVLDLKHWTHYLCLLSANLSMIYFIDTFGVFDILGLYASVVIEYVLFMPLQAGSCMIIYSHFHAHFLTIRRPFPAFVKPLFSISLTVKSCISLIVLIATWQVNDSSIMVIYWVVEEIWLACFLISDLTGYYLVRSAIIELLQSQSSFLSVSTTASGSSSIRLKKDKNENEDHDSKEKVVASNSEENLNFQVPNEEARLAPSSEPNRTPTATPTKPKKTRTTSITTINYLEFLARMRTFHGAVCCCSSLFLLFFAAAAVDLASNQKHEHIPASVYFAADPAHFPYASMIIAYFALFFWLCLTWWSWLPFHSREDEEGQNSETTKLPENQNTSSKNRTAKGGGAGEENSDVGTTTTSGGLGLGGEVELVVGNGNSSNSPTPSSRATMDSQTLVTIATIGEDGELNPVPS